MMLCVFTFQLIWPLSAVALTSGPSQPEVQSFEPVGTTDMVDLFTGDFVYNIPLLDVEGYPVNISYHSGVDMEQEASWVGLGWNINPGAINRAVRGMPDDFKGETISKEFNIKPEKNVRVGVGVGAEIAGVGSPLIKLSANLSLNLNASNYKGISTDFTLGGGVNVAKVASAGIDLGISSQNGADIDYNVGLSFSTSQIVQTDIAAGVGVSYGHGYNTRSGLKDKSFSLSGSVSVGAAGVGRRFRSTVPIGIKNIIPVVTNSTTMTMFRGQIKIGGEIFAGYPHPSVSGMVSTLSYNNDGSRSGYGYLYAQEADDASIMDFTRDRDGIYNETMHYLPAGNMTYDVYSVSGQGTGGSFRPFRNDFGSVYDPRVSNAGKEASLELEAGIGNLFELGTDISVSKTDITSGPWDQYKRPFTDKRPGSLYENVYFKQAGEASAINSSLFSAIGGLNPIKGTATGNIPSRKPGSEQERDPRGNLIYYFTGEEAERFGVASSTSLQSYSTQGFASGPDVTKETIARVSTERKSHHISEVVQVQTDGRRYVYGIPALNRSQQEVTFACDPTGDNNGLYTINDPSDITTGNTKGRDNFFSKTATPPFAHSYLLTSVLSTDYVDITGDGPTDDDFGTFTKFNYSRKNAAYKWRAPYGNNKAQYNPGFKSDALDDKASYLEGSREQWLLHSIESKHFVAEFYTSERLDACGKDTISDLSYKLDSIKLYNKHDRFVNETSAVPVKTVIFQYDYSLCRNVANNKRFMKGITNTDVTGKLTLQRIYIRYGNSDKNMLSPYRFAYGSNYNYAFANKDRWGMYKPNNPTLSNNDFPFVNQADTQLDDYAGAWSLDKITLPSGGVIDVSYESDDYAFVQDKAAMEMFMLNGMGNSTDFSAGNQLYFDKNSANTYLYFTRRTAQEKSGLSFEENYLNKQRILYFNVETRLTGSVFEPIKGYAEVEAIGPCPDGVHGYIKLKPASITGGGASLNPITYTALNFARYYLPHILFPGSDPSQTDLGNILSGMQYAFSELVSFTKNPLQRMVEEGKAKEVRLSASYCRLNSPGLRKKGGGARVRQLTFSDNWKQLAGGNSQNASYGKNYYYTTEDAGNYGVVSSGVASYEPQIGGDENPFREPVNYAAQSGSRFPPVDPVGIYQELPVGESLYPSPVVGYSKVRVESIHRDKGVSAQGVDIYDFYTAKDFPIQASVTSLDPLATRQKYTFTEQERVSEGTQGYTLVFNDMHGKPKRTEHRIVKPATGMSELVSYQHYIYHTDGAKLNNTVPVIEFDPQEGKMKRQYKQVAMEADLTIDTREKKEETSSNTMYLNLNLFLAGIFPIPIPWFYPADFNFRNEFRSVVATKVVQQYGILKEVQSFQEGALTTVHNEAFDALTGKALITSVNNEFDDKEYDVTYPAYWGYKTMGPSYTNTGYEQEFDSIPIINHAAYLPNISSQNFKIGDEVSIAYTLGTGTGRTNAWVDAIYLAPGTDTGAVLSVFCRGGCNNTENRDTTVLPFRAVFNSPCAASLTQVPRPQCGKLTLVLKPRYKNTWPASGALTKSRLKVIRSGAKNQLQESIQNYVTMEMPFDSAGFLNDKLNKLISLSGRTFSDTLTAILPRYDSLQNPSNWDSLNVFLNGTRQVKRLAQEYVYMKKRNYSAVIERTPGLFSAASLWFAGGNPDRCVQIVQYCNNPSFGGIEFGGFVKQTSYLTPSTINDYNYFSPKPENDPGWLVSRSVTKWSPWGQELENRDAIGNYTTAQYGYQHALPVCLAQNARQHQVFTENFEDYKVLQILASLNRFHFSPFASFFSLAGLSGSPYAYFDSTGSSGFRITGNAAHSGYCALATTGAVNLSLPVKADPQAGKRSRYLSFSLEPNKRYLVSYWFRPQSPPGALTGYTAPAGFSLKSNIIDGWQQVEQVLNVPGNVSSLTIALPAGAYVDDIRIMPVSANMKAFVYHPFNQRLLATLDENNFASFYEYDQEGNLIRTKRETENGIMTVTESRSAQAGKYN